MLRRVALDKSTAKYINAIIIGSFLKCSGERDTIKYALKQFIENVRVKMFIYKPHNCV